MLDKIRGFHIEPTNMCTLRCPQCSRTDFISKFPNAWKNTNLNLDDLKNFLDIDITGFQFALCGNYGDPIYYPKIFELLRYLKDNNSHISLSTNGSYKSADWWVQLSDIIGDGDKITFGIDGMPENFTQYRINADWESIKTGIQILTRTNITTEWQFIPFSFNENDIGAAKKLSEDMGIDIFKILHSDRHDMNSGWLSPKTQTNDESKKEYVSQWKQTAARDSIISAECKSTNSAHYISASGFYSPCCYVSDHRFYYQSEFYKNKELYDISKTTISKLLSLQQVTRFYNSLDDSKLKYCTYNCPKLGGGVI